MLLHVHIHLGRRIEAIRAVLAGQRPIFVVNGHVGAHQVRLAERFVAHRTQDGAGLGARRIGNGGGGGDNGRAAIVDAGGRRRCCADVAANRCDVTVRHTLMRFQRAHRIVHFMAYIAREWLLVPVDSHVLP